MSSGISYQLLSDRPKLYNWIRRRFKSINKFRNYKAVLCGYFNTCRASTNQQGRLLSCQHVHSCRFITSFVRADEVH